MESESVITTIPPEEISDSPSSVTVEASISDSQEQITTSENVEKDEKAEEERKVRRQNRRLALAMAKSPLPAPKLGKVLTSANNTIDLTCEDDDPSNKWFKKTFAAQLAAKAAKKKSPEGVKQFAVPRAGTKTYVRHEDMKKQLQASMSAKRRKEQEQRRKMYAEDNEHLKPSDDEEEEEEPIVRKKKTVSKEEEYDSEDDEDYKPPENGQTEEDDKLRDDDGMSVNFLNDSFTYDVFNNVKRSGPGSIISNFDARSQIGDAPGGSGSDDFDLLALCSGKFESSVAVAGALPDTLAMLLEDEKKAARQEIAQKDADEDEDEEEESMFTKKSKPSRIVDSDDEGEESEKAPQGVSQDVFADSDEPKKDEEASEDLPKPRPSRIVLSGDEDSEDDGPEDADDEEEAEEDAQEDDEDDEDVEEEPEEPEEEAPDAPEPNFDDEDDELAVIKRIEHQEFKEKIKKKTLFDDEASLSGDDVGSDVEDDEGGNDYEAEEGDADDVPDDDTIRRQNYKLLLKQESDKEHRALAKLQDRLLADGDLGGVETNRQFRFKLREEVEIQMGDIADQEDTEADDEPEEDEEKKKERAELIKYKLEHADKLIEEPEEDDDLFRRAGRMMKKETKLTIEASEEVVIKANRNAKPSLLSKSTLAVSFQEVLAGQGPVAKQMYVQNFNSTTSTSSSGAGAGSGGSRLSNGGVKRGRQSPEQSGSKRVKQSKLSALE